MFFAANGARFGFMQTVPANIGYHIATWIVTCAIGFGLGRVVLEYPSFLITIKYLGSLYVFYLAWCLYNSGTIENNESAERSSFMDGVILLLFNPKAYLIIILIFTQFIQMDDQSPVLLIMVITTVFTINNLVAFSIWAFIGDRLASIFQRGTAARNLNRLFGIILALVAIWMLLG